VLRVAVLAVVSVVASGHFGELRVTHAGSVKLQRGAPSAFPAGPGPNIGDVEFLSARVGFGRGSRRISSPQSEFATAFRF